MILSTCSINSMLPVCTTASSTIIINNEIASGTSGSSGSISDLKYRPYNNNPPIPSAQLLKNGHLSYSQSSGSVTTSGSTMPKDTHQTHPQQQLVLLQQQQGFHKNEMVKSKSEFKLFEIIKKIYFSLILIIPTAICYLVSL